MTSEMDLLIERYLRNLRNSVSQKTKEDYKQDLNAFKDYLADNNLNIKIITLEDLEYYAEYLTIKPIKNGSQIGYAESSQNRMLQLIKYFFNYLVGINYITENPSTMLKLTKIPYREPKYLTLKEAKKLLKSVDKEENEFLRIRDKAIILTFLNHGLRVDEMAKIKITDIKDGVLSIIGKGDKERTVCLTDDTLHAIKNYLKVRYKVETDYLFLSMRREAINKRTIQSMTSKYLLSTGLKGYSVHKLRSTAATLMSDQGIDVADIQEILGHENISTTKKYAATSMVKKEQIANKMNGLYTS